MEENKDLKNGLDLLYMMYVVIETIEEYKLKGTVKNKANLFKNEIEKSVIDGINKMLVNDEEMTQNALKLKKQHAQQVASLNEADQLLLNEFTNKFINNIDIAREKGVLFFDKLL